MKACHLARGGAPARRSLSVSTPQAMNLTNLRPTHRANGPEFHHRGKMGQTDRGGRTDLEERNRGSTPKCESGKQTEVVSVKTVQYRRKVNIMRFEFQIICVIILFET